MLIRSLLVSVCVSLTFVAAPPAMAEKAQSSRKHDDQRRHALELIQQLKLASGKNFPAQRERLRITLELGKLTESRDLVTPVLVSLLTDDSYGSKTEKICDVAGTCLASTPHGRESLERHFGDKDPHLAGRAVHYWMQNIPEQVSEAALEKLLSWLKSKPQPGLDDPRYYSILALNKIESARPHLRAALQSANSLVRQGAIDSLSGGIWNAEQGNLSPREIELLLTLVDDPAPGVRHSIARALGSATCDLTRVVHALLELSKTDFGPSSDSLASISVRCDVSLCRRMIPLLLTHCSTNPIASNQVLTRIIPRLDSTEKQAIIAAILDGGTNDNRQIDVRLLDCISEAGEDGKEAIPVLQRLIVDTDLETRVSAAGCLWSIQGNAEAILPTLVEAILEAKYSGAKSNAHKTLRKMAAQALPAVPELKCLAESKGHDGIMSRRTLRVIEESLVSHMRSEP